MVNASDARVSARAWRRIAGLATGALLALLWVLRPLKWWRWRTGPAVGFGHSAAVFNCGRGYRVACPTCGELLPYTNDARDAAAIANMHREARSELATELWRL